MRTRGLLILILSVIAVPAAYHIWRPATAPSAPQKALNSEEVKWAEGELKVIKVRVSDPPRLFDVPGREFVPPLPVG